MKRYSGRKRIGFTIIELLIVILIIGILAGLFGGALVGVRKLFSGLTAKQEISNIEQAVEAYKMKHGEYPPDAFATDKEIQRHILLRWKGTLKAGTLNNSIKHFNTYVRTLNNGIPTTPEKVLLFWLCGPERYYYDSGNVLSSVPEERLGFSANPENPFDLIDPKSAASTFEVYASNAPNANKSYEAKDYDLSYDLDPTDSRNSGNCNGYALVYKDAPVVYFRSVKMNQSVSGRPSPTNCYFNMDGVYKYFDYRNSSAYGDLGVAVPYSKGGTWKNAESFQLILPGDDQRFSATVTGNDADSYLCPRDLTTPGTMTYLLGTTNNSVTLNIMQIHSEDNDNVTNFASGGTIESDIDN